MSHFTTLKTALTDRQHLARALADLGLQPVVGQVEVQGFAGQRTLAELKVVVGGDREIGFRRVGATYEMVADWFFIKQLDPARFARQLTQRYAYHAARAELAAQGFDLVHEETRQDGTVHLVVRRMAG